MKNQFKIKLLSALVMSAFLTACGGSSGGSGGSSSNNTTDQNTTDQGQTSTEESLANLSVQIIDGYLPSIDVCIVNQKLECDDRFDTIKTDDKGKASFNLTKSQQAILQDLGYVKFKAIAPKGSRDLVFDRERSLSTDLTLIGTKFFNGGDLKEELTQDESESNSFKITPFTTLVEYSIDHKDHPVARDYEKLLSDIVEKLGTDLNTVISDYNESNDGSASEDNAKALVAGELISSLNLLSKSIADVISEQKDTDYTFDTIVENLQTIKVYLENILKAASEDSANSSISSTAIVDAINDKNETLSKSFISLSTGHGDEWRCGTTKANEVWCWGNNAWSNLGNHDFSQRVKDEGKYSTNAGDNKDNAYLLNNWTADPVPVQIKNPNKITDNDPEYINLAGITKVHTGNIFGCGISLEKEVWCWGDNSKGQLGLGKEAVTNAPSADQARYDYAQRVIAGQQNSKSGYLSNVVDLSIGQNQVCALTGDGDIYCWGDNTALELGAEFKDEGMRLPWHTPSWNNDDLDNIVWIVPHPVKVPAPEGVKFTYLTKGGYWSHCALTDPKIDEYNLWCWGDDTRGLVSGENDQYVDEIAQNWAGKNHKNEGVYTTTETWNWHYWEKGGEWYPMFGRPLTQVKSRVSHREEYSVCNDSNQEACFWVEYCYSDFYGTGYYWNFNDVQDLAKGQSCKIEDESLVEFKNIKTIDITEYDSVFYFTSYDDLSTVTGFYTDNASNGIQEANTWTIVDSSSDLLNHEDISLITTGVETAHGFILTQAGHLYEVGSDRYGIKGNGHASNDYVTKVLTPSGYVVQDVGINKRSACALVENPRAKDSDEIQLYCWGSSTFGQLGIDNKDNNFSYMDTAFSWDNGNNEYFDKETRIESTPIRIDEDLTFRK